VNTTVNYLKSALRGICLKIRFRARSRRRHVTHGIESIGFQTTHARRKNSVIDNQDNDKEILLTNSTIITKCLTTDRNYCIGFYRNKFIAHVFLCKCGCHKKSKVADSKPRHYSYHPEVEHSTVDVRHVKVT
jgi:hypothetical protein